MLSAEFLPASSRTSKGDCGFYQRSLERSNQITFLRAMKTYLNFSRIYERSYPITGFVIDLDSLLDVDKDNRRYNIKESMIRDVF